MKWIVKIKALTLAALLIAMSFTSSGYIPPTSAESTLDVSSELDSGAHLFELVHDRSDYVAYISEYKSVAHSTHEIVLEGSEYSHVEGKGFEKLSQFEGQQGVSLKTGEQGSVNWSVDIPETGLYHIEVLYYPIEGKSSTIERSLLIDGEVPFEEAAYLQFDRIWDDKSKEIERDNQGNDLRPQQVENPEWRTAMIKDFEGYYEKPFQFYLTAGTHTISLISQREPMVIKHLKLFHNEDAIPYEEIAKRYKKEDIHETKNHLITIQAEEASAKSSPTLYPQTERNSPAVKPYSPKYTKVNTIGGFNWRIPGQWIEWEVNIPETGLYKIGVKSQQNFVRGIYSTRRLTIDGKVSFKEMERVAFRFDNNYRINILGDDVPYLFELEKGKHILRMETSLGEFASLIREVEDSLYNLNAMYRKILMITGASPDALRDYRVEQQVPNLIDAFQAESSRLKGVSKELHRLSGGTGEAEALLKTMSIQLDEMIEEPHTISKRLSSYKTNVGGLGTWLLKAREMPLEIDSIYIASPNKKIPTEGIGFFDNLKHEAMVLIHSFFTDYNQIGNISNEPNAPSVTVWVGSGRDQANTLKAMIDETFTPDTGINVNLKLVQMQTLLPATLAGQGPDVAMQISNDIPVNYAMRNAAADLTQFNDYEEVRKRFRPSAMVPFEYDDGVYALPETQTFDMLFYRKDVLNELGLEIPQTWEDVANVLAVLNKNHMEFGLPVVLQPANPGENLPPNSVYGMLLMQNGGQFYRNGGRESDLDSRVGVETFKTWTEFYTDYKLDREFDFPNRFRTGQMPIGIADYTTYNQLQVFAPEIRGLWGFVPVPGTVEPDGSLRRDVPSKGSGVIMLESAKNKAAGWEFMKWWTSDEVQTKFGREMESLMGAAARYPTANIKALDSLPWPVTDYENLKLQFKSVQGIPEVPGGYFTGRHLFNAFYQIVVNSGDQSFMGITIPGVRSEPRETIVEYVQYIDEEIAAKRKEFGLPE